MSRKPHAAFVHMIYLIISLKHIEMLWFCSVFPPHFLPVLEIFTFSPPYICVSGLYASLTLEALDLLCKPFLPAHKPTVQY